MNDPLRPLPDGIVVREDTQPRRLDLPALLDELASGEFSGTLGLRADSGWAGGILLLRGAVVHAEAGPMLAAACLAEILKEAEAHPLRAELLRLTDKIAGAYLALFAPQHTRSMRPQDLAPGAGNLRQEQFNGCLQVRADEGRRSALVLYSGGWPIQTYWLREGALTSATGTVHELAAEPGAMVEAFRAPSEREADGLSILRRLDAGGLPPMLEAVRRAGAALRELAGPVKADEYLAASLSAAATAHPWLATIEIDSNGEPVAGAAFGPFRQAEAVAGLLAVIDGAGQRAGDLLGGRLVESTLRRALEDLRGALEAIGVPPGWPGA